MLLACSHCGAPLDVGATADEVKCAYCGTKTLRQRLRVVSAETPSGWHPPSTWSPRASSPVGSLDILQYRARLSGAPPAAVAKQKRSLLLVLLAWVLGVLVVVGVACGAVCVGLAKLGGDRSDAYPPAALRDITMAESKDQVLARLPKSTDLGPLGLRTYLKNVDTPYQYVNFSWHENHPSHVSGFAFAVKEGLSPNQAAKVCARLKEVLPSHWSEDVYAHGGFSLHCTSTYLRAFVHPMKGSNPNPTWKQESTALWKVVNHTVYGADMIADSEARMWLGLGYPVSDLTKLRWGVDLHGATSAVQEVFPAVHDTGHIGLHFEVALAHPWFRLAALEWPNTTGATLSTVYLYPSGVRTADGGAFPQQERLAKCVEPVLKAKARKIESDAMKRKFMYTINSSDMTVVVHEHLLTMRVVGSAVPTKNKFNALIAALDACGR